MPAAIPLRIDRHEPFATDTARRLLDYVQPQWLIHEFVQKSPLDWETKVAGQRAALELAGCKCRNVG